MANPRNAFQSVSKISWLHIAELQQSDEYADRFRAEFWALSKRLTNIDGLLYRWRNGKLNHIPESSYSLMNKQLYAMQDYWHMLILRAEDEDIDLYDDESFDEDKS